MLYKLADKIENLAIFVYFGVMNIHLKTFSTTEDLILQGLELTVSALVDSEKTEGIMLAGGRTPLEIYRRAAAEGLSTKASLFLSDERYVPISDPQSNYGGIAPFFNNVGQASSLSIHAKSQTTADRLDAKRGFLKESNDRRKWQPLSYVKRVRTELPIEEPAQAFHDELSQIERIPLGLLGLGADGHTASLFNLKDAAIRDERLAIPVIKTEKPDRIRVTPTLLNRIERIIILATGAEKKEMIQTLLNDPETIPAGVALADHPNVEIWTDV